MDWMSIYELFRRVAERSPDRVAVEQGERTVSYGRLAEDARRLAGVFGDRGLVAGDRVGVLCRDRASLVTVVLASLQGGFVFVPLDPAFPAARLHAMAREVEPACWVVEAKLLDRVHGIAGEAPIVVLDAAARPERAPLDVPEPPVDPDALCSIYFTSGSTGRPKAIAGRLKGIDHFIRWEMGLLEAAEGVRVSQLTSPAFDASLRDIFLPLCAGGVACAPPDRETVLDPEALAGWLESARIEVVHCVPSLFRALLGTGLRADRLPALRWVLLAGERLLPEDVRRWEEIFGGRVRLVNLYGATETTMTKLFYLVSPADGRRSSIPVGKPMPGTRAVVLDEQGRVCAPGMVGEIYVRTPYRSLGYFNRPDLTREVFVPNPLTGDANDLVYRTGDFGRLLEDGSFELVGRRDHQVKVRGARVELGEVENALRRHGAVRDLAVVDGQDAGGETRLIAYVVLDGEVAAGDLRRFCAEQLPDYTVPSVFVRLAALPRTVNGKLDRAALPPPVEAMAEAERDGRAPHGPVEELLAEIWGNLLGLPRVGADADFFELGGHSLLALRLLSRVRGGFGVELTLRTLFDAPTIARLACAIEEARREQTGEAALPLAPVARGGELPLSWAQERLWLLQQLASASTAYNVFRSLRLRGALRPDLLDRAFGEVVRRHESLRTTFHETGGRPFQVIGEASPFPLPLVDLAGLALRCRETEVERWGRELAVLPFDLQSGPLMRVLALRLGLEEHALFLTMHHIVSDAWSMNVLSGEVMTLYRALAAGVPARLPELPIQSVDWAVWQRHWLQGEVLASQIAFWRRHLAGAPDLLALPTDFPRPPVQSFRGAVYMLSLPEALGRDLRALARRESSTLFVTLLAAFLVSLQRQTGQDDLVIGTSVANRDQVELEHQIGFLTNQLALRFDLSGNPRFLEILTRVRRTMLDAHSHRYVPFQQVVEAVHPRRDPSRNPLFQVMFEMEHMTAPESGGEESLFHLEGLGIDRTQSRVDLTLHLLDDGPSLFGRIEYASDLFAPATIERLARRLVSLLARVVDRPESRLDELEILSEEEKGEEAERQQRRAKSGLSRFKAIVPKAVAMPRDILKAQGEPELLIVPDGEDHAQ